MKTNRRRVRRKALRSREDVAGALRQMGGESCTFSIGLEEWHSHDPGSLVVESTWRASLRIREGRATVCVVNAEEKTAAALVAAIRAQLRQRLTIQAADRRDRRTPAIVFATAEAVGCGKNRRIG